MFKNSPLFTNYTNTIHIDTHIRVFLLRVFYRLKSVDITFKYPINLCKKIYSNILSSNWYQPYIMKILILKNFSINFYGFSKKRRFPLISFTFCDDYSRPRSKRVIGVPSPFKVVWSVTCFVNTDGWLIPWSHKLHGIHPWMNTS